MYDNCAARIADFDALKVMVFALTEIGNVFSTVAAVKSTYEMSDS